MPVRVVEYRLAGVAGTEALYRLVTSVLEPQRAPARELAALYHERCEIETAFDELKTHLRGHRIVLRSKTPELVRQEFHGLPLAHHAARQLMHEAALQADPDPDRLSFLRAGGVCRGPQAADSRRYPPRDAPRLSESVLSEILGERARSSRGRRNPRGVERKMSAYPLQRDPAPLPPIPDIETHIRIPG